MANSLQQNLKIEVAEKKVQNVVFDCSSKNKQYVASRMWLIDMTAKELQENSTPYNIVLTIHSGCTDLVSKSAGAKDEALAKAQQMLEVVSKHPNVSIEACQIALDRFNITSSDMPSYIKQVRNSITRVIALQNDGYAFIPFSQN